MAKIKYILLALFVFLQVYLIFIKDFQVLDYSRYRNEYPPVPLSGENNKSREVSQTFRTPGPLAHIDILLANYKIKPKGGSLQLGVFNGEQCLCLKKYPANTVEDNRFYTFPITAGKVPAGNYTLRLKHFPGNKSERLAVWMYPKDIYPYGDLFVDNKKKEGDMTFRVYYLSTPWEQRHHILEKIPPIPFSRFWLIIGFFIALLMMNFLFYYFLDKVF
jgi:hypothetical protein